VDAGGTDAGEHGFECWRGPARRQRPETDTARRPAGGG
jgi:hypothetical protein